MDKFAKVELKTIGITDAVVSFFHARDMFLNIFVDQLPKIFPRSNDGEVADNARMKFVKDECSRITHQLPEDIRKDDHEYLLSGAAVWAKLNLDERQNRMDSLRRVMEYIYGKDKYEEKVEAILAGAKAHDEKLTKKDEKTHLKGAEVQHPSPVVSEKV
ncbi:hypothetical protein Ddc_24819 [Ditylenchus destructor]|nr:hypothetical protein Ddc_24819 [Ditylenchus destructor]